MQRGWPGRTEKLLRSWAPECHSDDGSDGLPESPDTLAVLREYPLAPPSASASASACAATTDALLAACERPEMTG